MAKLTLEQFISRKTDLARRKIFVLFQEGKITINGAKAKDITQMIDVKQDRIHLEGKLLDCEVPPLVYFKLNKPKGVITTLSDPQNRPTISDYIRRIPYKVVPIGRLDRDTTGLILITNDGELAHKIMHPSFHVSKLYHVTIDSAISKANLRRLGMGMILEDGPFQFNLVEQLSETSFKVTLSEGRNRIVRRAFSQIGYTVTKLKRLAIGPIQVGLLKEGQIKPLLPSELKALWLSLKPVKAPKKKAQ